MISTLIKKTKDETPILSNYDICNFSIDQLMELALKYTDNSEMNTAIKKEIYTRGKDDITQRINIKKSIRATVKSIENQINEEKLSHQEETKMQKNRFLSAISIQDRLEILWIKHDHTVGI